MANVGFVLRTSQKCKDLQWEINAPSPIDIPLETLSLLAFGSSVFSHGGWLVSQGRHLMVPELQQRSPRLSNLGKSNLAKSGKVWKVVVWELIDSGESCSILEGGHGF